MGTRGLYGFRKNGIDKTTYNHWDSYPSWLGLKVADFCCNHSMEDLHKICDGIILVDRDSAPTEKQINDCINNGFCDLEVGNQSTTDWYCLLRNCQGDLESLASHKDSAYMINYCHFIKESLWCEYAYIINLDDGVLEYWEGFQKQPQEGNRYGTEPSDDYYPCKLILTFPLDGITNPEQIIKMMELGNNVDQFKEIMEQYSQFNLTLVEASELGSRTILSIWDSLHNAVDCEARKNGCLDDDNKEDFNYELYGEDMLKCDKYFKFESSGRIIRYEITK